MKVENVVKAEKLFWELKEFETILSMIGGHSDSKCANPYKLGVLIKSSKYGWIERYLEVDNELENHLKEHYTKIFSEKIKECKKQIEEL